MPQSETFIALSASPPTHPPVLKLLPTLTAGGRLRTLLTISTDWRLKSSKDPQRDVFVPHIALYTPRNDPATDLRDSCKLWPPVLSPSQKLNCTRVVDLLTNTDPRETLQSQHGQL
ncbi:uncharacterized protein PV06_08331 [Exophiala oligosperma]|uniref:Uncharacterized protein n=1 Tax=Exophiala oligosperma TaxID=215243 RepID=A0A0D2DB81_9EURO|nr:uncharacterized protein PV06_08331 [Exophiala oligosperma]KIW39745.1 hypothetical protein PV06_08331 [Exophiala oligosperma]